MRTKSIVRPFPKQRTPKWSQQQRSIMVNRRQLERDPETSTIVEYITEDGFAFITEDGFRLVVE